MRYHFVQTETKNHDVQLLCKVMEVSRSGYYAFIHRKPSQRAKDEQPLLPLIQDIFVGSRKSYGYRRVHAELQKQAVSCGKHKTAKLMSKLNLTPKPKRKFKFTTDSKHFLPIVSNVLNRDFKPSQKNQAWVSDITYIATQQGWLYLAVVMDLYPRAIVGWAMDKQMTKSLVINALSMALMQRQPLPGLILHSDRGRQYASYEYQDLLTQHKIIGSMSGRGNCWDNAPMESFFRSLKTECVYQQSFHYQQEAKAEIFSYIEVFYNRQRSHSTLHYLSPMAYELAYANL